MIRIIKLRLRNLDNKHLKKARKFHQNRIISWFLVILPMRDGDSFVKYVYDITIVGTWSKHVYAVKKYQRFYVGWAIVWVLWHINPCRLFNAKFCIYSSSSYTTKNSKNINNSLPVPQKVPFYDPSGNISIQIDGISMGSPLGPTILEFYMFHIENKIFKTITKPNLYICYGDNIFIATHSYNEIKLKL